MENMSAGNDKPVLIYDDNCGFCRLWVSRWSPFTQDAVIYHPSQDAAENYPQISPQQLESSVYFVASDGSFCSGAQAVFKTLAYAPNGKWFLKAYKNIPGFAPVSEWIYRQISKNRKTFSTVACWVWGTSMKISTLFLTRRVFLFLLGLVYLLAFGSI
jgi:lipase maturation factor 1